MKKNTSFFRKGNAVVAVLLVVLLICELLASVMLVTRLVNYSEAKKYNYISLTENKGNTRVTVSTKETAALTKAVKTSRTSLSRKPAVSAAAAAVNTLASTRTSEDTGEFIVYDENTVWTAMTDIEIFKLTYDNNGDAVFTVVSSNDEKVIAPGTENDYEFALENTKSKALDYTLEVESFFVGEDKEGNPITIPVESRMVNEYTNTWLSGSATEYVDVLDLNNVRDSAVIGSGKIIPYKLQWRWPFERGEGDELIANDEFDTALGNLALDEDLELHIIIRTVAELDDDDGGGDNPPPTGDSSGIVLWIVVAAVSFVLLVLLLIGGRFRKKEEDK